MREWIKAAGIRALRTMAQAAIAAMASATLITDVHWGVVAATAAMAGVMSLLMSISGLPELKEGGANAGDTANDN